MKLERFSFPTRESFCLGQPIFGWEVNPPILSVCLCVSTKSFEPVGSFLCNSAGNSCHWRWRRSYNPVSSTIPKMADIKLLIWIQNMHHSMLEHEILKAEKSSTDKQLLIRLILSKPKYYSERRLKFTIYLYCALWRQPMNHCTQTNEVWRSKRSWTYLQVDYYLNRYFVR
jgi:hypothetical protein